MSSDPLSFRAARRADLDAIVRMLADDPIAAKRERYEQPLPASYEAAFKAIDGDPNNELIVAELGGEVVGALQITYIPNLTYEGSWRCLIEGVRIDAPHRGKGYGRLLMEQAVERARARGCCVVQLMSNKARSAARRFYESIGFTASHEGFKYHLDGAG